MSENLDHKNRRLLLLLVHQMMELDIKVEALLRLVGKTHPSHDDIQQTIEEVRKEKIATVDRAISEANAGWIGKWLEDFEGPEQ